MTPEQQHAVQCSDAWCIARGLPSYTDLLTAARMVDEADRTAVDRMDRERKHGLALHAVRGCLNRITPPDTRAQGTVL